MSTDATRRRHGRSRSIAASAIAGTLLLVLPAVVRADVDIANDWVVTFSIDPPSAVSFTCDLGFTQNGASLSAGGECRGYDSFASFVGTIDPGTGAFSLSGEIAIAWSQWDVQFVGISFEGTPLDASHLGGTATIDGNPGTFAASLCGNGDADEGEACDDGTATNGCCNADCTPKPDGIACGTTAACQIAPTCSAGACAGAPQPAGTECEADGNACTDDACDGAGSCAPGPCSPCCGGPSCTSNPRSGCQHPSNDRDLVDVQATPLGAKPKDKIIWRIPRMEATSATDLPDPETTDYAVCFYVLNAFGDFQLLFDATAPAGLGCGRKRCWTRNAKGGVAYNGGPLRPDGVASLRVKPGADGKASLSFTGRGPNLDLPTPLFIPGPELFPGGELLVQLRAGDGCWSAQYATSGVRPDIRTETRYRTRGGF